MDVEVVRKSRGIDPKERKPRSTAQLPVYREASRLASRPYVKSIGCRYSIPISDFWHIHGRTESDSISRPCLRTTGIDISFW